MLKFKISSHEIEKIFHFMNHFKDGELFHFEYSTEEKDLASHVLKVSFGLMTKRKFLSRLESFVNVHGKCLLIKQLIPEEEYLDSSYNYPVIDAVKRSMK